MASHILCHHYIKLWEISFACCILLCLLGVDVTVDDRMPYIVNENESLILINLLLNQPSCHPITIIANPQERPLPSATGTYVCDVDMQRTYLYMSNDFPILFVCMLYFWLHCINVFYNSG